MPKLSGFDNSKFISEEHPYGFVPFVVPNEELRKYYTPEQLASDDAKIAQYNDAIAKNNNSLQNLIDNKASEISIAAKKRIINAVNCLYVLSDDKQYEYIVPEFKRLKGGKVVPNNLAGQKRKGTFRVNMVTLTLCHDQLHDDKYIKSEMLEAFIRKLKDKHGMRSYIWRAERQKNGRIHFHIISNVFFPHAEVRKYWNSIQKTHGYIDAYMNKGGNDNPNGTDVHSMYKIRKLTAYLSKYMAKSTDKDVKPIEGRQWYLSSNLSKIEPILIEGASRDFEDEIVSIVGDKWKNFDYALVAYVDIFSRDLANYPLVKEVKENWIQQYKPTVI